LSSDNDASTVLCIDAVRAADTKAIHGHMFGLLNEFANFLLLGYYTMGHNKRVSKLFATTSANVDRFR